MDSVTYIPKRYLKFEIPAPGNCDSVPKNLFLSTGTPFKHIFLFIIVNHRHVKSYTRYVKKSVNGQATPTEFPIFTAHFMITGF